MGFSYRGVTTIGITALIAAGIGAAGSVGSAVIGSNASKAASAAQVTEQQQALQQQQTLYNQGLQTQGNYVQTAQNTLLPFINAGQSVLPTLQGLITPGPNQNALLSQTPGFQFAQQYGSMAATNALASRGLGASAGPVATALSQYNQGLAQNTWGSVVNALQGYAGLGANAGGQFASIAGNAGNAALGAGIQAGNSQASTLTGIGQSQAQGILGSANAIAGGINGVTGAANNALTSNALYSYLQNGSGGGGGLYSPNALQNGPTNSQISNMSDAQASQYEQMFG